MLSARLKILCSALLALAAFAVVASAGFAKHNTLLPNVPNCGLGGAAYENVSLSPCARFGLEIQFVYQNRGESRPAAIDRIQLGGGAAATNVRLLALLHREPQSRGL